MSLGFWVVVVVMGFFIGTVMGLKPKLSDVRLGECRLFARKIQLHPKLVPTPDFIKARYAPKMTASYTVIDDRWRLPFAELIAQDGAWHSDTPHSPLLTQILSAHTPSVQMPHQLSAYFLGLTIKANSISLFWKDESYIKGFGVRDDNVETKIQHDLHALKAYLMAVGDELTRP